MADTSVWYDRKIKAPLYAEFEIPEYWLLDTNEEVVVVRTEPVSGSYRQVKMKKRGQSIQPCRIPAVVFPVDELLGLVPTF